MISKMEAHFLILTLIFSLNLCVSKKYNKYKLYRGIPVNESHMEFFTKLGDQFDINYWKFPGAMYMPTDFIVSPEEQPAFLLEAKRRGVYVHTVIEDVQKAFEMQTVKPYVRRKMDTFNWQHYFRLNDIYKWLRDLKRAFPRKMELRVIGKTHENRDIMAVKIMHSGRRARSKVIVEGGIHAREWITPAFVTYLISQILRADESKNLALKKIATTFEWHFIPVLNPDGYEYTHTKDRLWRKNRNHDYGIDLNRNFGADFGIGVSDKTGSEVYCGDKAFSEKESQALAEYVRSKSADLEYYISFHSYGQYMILPYAYSKTHEDNYDEMHYMCKQAAVEIAAKYGTTYQIGTAYDTVGYTASGVSGCWVKKTFSVPYVVTFELRDTGYYGFALPPEKIMPTCNETMDGIISLLTPRSYQFKKPNYTIARNGQKKIFNKMLILFVGNSIFIIISLY